MFRDLPCCSALSTKTIVIRSAVRELIRQIEIVTRRKKIPKSCEMLATPTACYMLRDKVELCK
jgi:hypothetical protein